MSHTEKEKMPSGDGLMPDTSLEGLWQKHKTERDHKAAGRLLAGIKRKEGIPIRDIARSMEKPYATIYTTADPHARILSRGKARQV